MNSHEDFWRAKRLCALSARAFSIASKRLRGGLTCEIALRRGAHLQKLALKTWNGGSHAL